MIIRKKFPFLFLFMVFVMLLVSACSQVITLPTGSQSSLTPLQVLKNSANAMKQLKSSHIELRSTSSLQMDNTATPTAGSVPSTVNVDITGSGDQALPDQEQLHLTISPNINLAQIVLGDKVYVQNSQGQWFVLDKNNFQGLASNPFSSFSFDPNSLLALIQNVKITDHGADTLNGQSLRHITAALDKNSLQQILAGDPQLKNLIGQGNNDTLLNDIQSVQSSVDVWIDETTFYVHRTQIKLNLAVNTHTSEGAAPSVLKTNLNTTIDLSKFNDPVTIKAPANAIPTNNPGVIFGSGTP